MQVLKQCQLSGNCIEFLPESISAAVATSKPTTMEPSISLDSGFSNNIIVTEPTLSGFTENISNSAPATLQYGGLAAIGSPEWTLMGLIFWMFKLINVSTGLPWFWIIIAPSFPGSQLYVCVILFFYYGTVEPAFLYSKPSIFTWPFLTF